MLCEKRFAYKSFLEENIKFSEHMNKLKNSNDLLI